MLNQAGIAPTTLIAQLAASVTALAFAKKQDSVLPTTIVLATTFVMTALAAFPKEATLLVLATKLVQVEATATKVPASVSVAGLATMTSALPT